MNNDLNPQIIIDELAQRLNSATLENVVLSTKLKMLTNQIEFLSQGDDEELEVVVGDSFSAEE
jgi:hypothetical protein